MDKKKIREYLSETFLNEDATPGITVTNKVLKDSGKINKAGVKAIEKDVENYDKEMKKDGKEPKMATNKFNYNDEFQKTFHDEMEIMNGQEMIQYDSKPNDEFIERAKEGIEGSSRMGNKGGKEVGNAEETWGASSDDFGKNLVKRIKSSTKKRSEQTPTLNLRGKDIQADLKDTGHKPYAIEESKSVNELTKGYVNKIRDKVIDFKISHDSPTHNDPFLKNRMNLGSKKLSSYINPDIKSYIENLGGNVSDNVGSNRIIIAFPNKAKDNNPNTKIFISITNNSANIESGSIIDLPEKIQVLLPKIIKRIQNDINSQNTSENNKPKIREMASTAKPISEKNKAVLASWVQKLGSKETAEKLINYHSETGMVSDFPDSMEYGTGLNKISDLLARGDYDNAYHKAKLLAKKLEKKAMRDMMGESKENKNNDNNKTQIKESMKRLKFKNKFNGLGNALNLIPEGYKVDNKVFEMTDGNENYRIRWEGSLSEGKAVVLTASDKTLVSEDIKRMKELFGYKSQDTLGLVKGNARLDENKIFGDIWKKSKALLEGEDIENADAKEGNWEDETKKAPEATKHVQGSTSKDKGTKAPKAKEGNPDDAVSSAPEAKKHISTASKSNTSKPKEGNWEDVGGGEKMMEIEAPEAKEGNWDEISMTHAPEAKKHVQGSVSTEKGTMAPKPKEGNWDENVKGQASEAKKNVSLKENEDEEEIMEEDDMMKEQMDDEYGSETSSSNDTDDDDAGEEEAADDDWNKSDDDSTEEKEPDAKDLKTTPSVDMDDDDDDDDEAPIVAPASNNAGGSAQLLFSPSTGVYWIKGEGYNEKVGEEYLELASDKSIPSKERASMIIAKMKKAEMGLGGDEIDEYNETHQNPKTGEIMQTVKK